MFKISGLPNAYIAPMYPRRYQAGAAFLVNGISCYAYFDHKDNYFLRYEQRMISLLTLKSNN